MPGRVQSWLGNSFGLWVKFQLFHNSEWWNLKMKSHECNESPFLSHFYNALETRTVASYSSWFYKVKLFWYFYPEEYNGSLNNFTTQNLAKEWKFKIHDKILSHAMSVYCSSTSSLHLKWLETRKMIILILKG